MANKIYLCGSKQISFVDHFIEGVLRTNGFKFIKYGEMWDAQRAIKAKLTYTEVDIHNIELDIMPMHLASTIIDEAMLIINSQK